jgi:hypothetical protein
MDVSSVVGDIAVPLQLPCPGSAEIRAAICKSLFPKMLRDAAGIRSPLAALPKRHVCSGAKTQIVLQARLTSRPSVT